MKNINFSSGVNNSAAEELFPLLKRFLENKKLKTADIPDDLSELFHLCEIHSLQPILCYMLLGETSLLRERYPDLEKKIRDQYLASAIILCSRKHPQRKWRSAFTRQESRLLFLRAFFCGAFILSRSCVQWGTLTAWSPETTGSWRTG